MNDFFGRHLEPPPFLLNIPEGLLQVQPAGGKVLRTHESQIYLITKRIQKAAIPPDRL